MATDTHNPDRDALVRATLLGIAELYRSRRGFSPREWLEVDLSMPQLKTLFFLYTGGPSRVTDVAGSLGVTLPTATTLLDRLEERGLACRKSSPGDRRVVLCGLTDDGSRLAESLRQVSRERFSALLEALDTAQLRQVAEAVGLLVEASRKAERAAPSPT